jgi:hypothetical protein
LVALPPAQPTITKSAMNPAPSPAETFVRFRISAH